MKNLLILIFIFFFFSYNATKSYDPITKAFGQTTNATPLSLHTFSLGTGQTIRITADVLGKSGNNRLRAVKTTTIKNISGTLTIIGGIISDISPVVSDVALATAGWTIVISGTNVITQVTGIAATTIDWTSNITYYID